VTVPTSAAPLPRHTTFEAEIPASFWNSFISVSATTSLSPAFALAPSLTPLTSSAT